MILLTYNSTDNLVYDRSIFFRKNLILQQKLKLIKTLFFSWWKNLKNAQKVYVKSSISYFELAPLARDITYSNRWRCRGNIGDKKLSAEHIPLRYPHKNATQDLEHKICVKAFNVELQSNHTMIFKLFVCLFQIWQF